MIIMINGSFAAGKSTVAEMLVQRLAQREHTDQARAWILERIERCVPALKSPTFHTQIPTDERTPEEIVEEILAVIEE